MPIPFSEVHALNQCMDVKNVPKKIGVVPEVVPDETDFLFVAAICTTDIAVVSFVVVREKITSSFQNFNFLMFLLLLYVFSHATFLDLLLHYKLL